MITQPKLSGKPGQAPTRHPEPARDLDHGLAVMNDQRHRLIPLLHDTQLHQHERSVKHQPNTPTGISRNRVKDQPKPHTERWGGWGSNPRPDGL